MSEQAELYYFSAGWCSPCRMQKAYIEQLEREADGKYRVVRVDTDNPQGVEIAAKFNVSAIPTMVVVKGGKACQTFVGVTRVDAMKKALEDAA